MDSLQSTYKDEEEGDAATPPPTAIAAAAVDDIQPPELEPNPGPPPPPQNDDDRVVIKKEEPSVSASESLSESDRTTSNDDGEDEEEEEEEEEGARPKKQRKLSSLTTGTRKTEEKTPVSDSNTGENNNVSEENKTPTTSQPPATTKKKSKKKNNNNVWVTRSTRKGKKKTKPNSQNAPAEDKVLITPVPRFPDKNDDSPDMRICLSKVYKAEKVELSEDRMCAGSTKGYRMVRATRGVCEGAWYFEIKVVSLGESGHTRLGWSTEKGDLQAPVGYDANSFGYRDVDGSKVHKALREKYGVEGYKEGDIVGFYINLPEGGSYAPKPPRMVWYKGQRYVCAPDAKEDPPKIVPGSAISFFKNGVCQGVAFKDLYGGCYYPAASMYTLPNQPNCVVKFNFGPAFEFFPEDFGERPVPRPLVEVPYHAFEPHAENGVSNEKKP